MVGQASSSAQGSGDYDSGKGKGDGKNPQKGSGLRKVAMATSLLEQMQAKALNHHPELSRLSIALV